MKKNFVIGLLYFVFSSLAVANVKTEVVSYQEGQTKLTGKLFYNASLNKQQTAVLVVHDWMGVGEFSENVAKKLADLGYAAMAVDIYGKENNPKDQKEAAVLATKFKDDRKLLKARIQAAYDVLAKQKFVDTKKIYVIGYCFGGTTALELARSGADIAGAVSFHGGLGTPNPTEAKNVRGDILVLHGKDDPFVPKAEMDGFMNEMKDLKTQLTVVYYPNAVHSFTNPKAGNDNSKGAAYNAKADKHSWRVMLDFLEQKKIEM